MPSPSRADRKLHRNQSFSAVEKMYLNKMGCFLPENAPAIHCNSSVHGILPDSCSYFSNSKPIWGSKCGGKYHSSASTSTTTNTTTNNNSNNYSDAIKICLDATPHKTTGTHSHQQLLNALRNEYLMKRNGDSRQNDLIIQNDLKGMNSVFSKLLHYAYNNNNNNQIDALNPSFESGTSISSGPCSFEKYNHDLTRPPLSFIEEHAEAVKAMLDKSVDPGTLCEAGDGSQSSKSHSNPFLDAAYAGHWDVMEILLKHQTDYLNSRSPIGENTALHLAASNGHLNVVRMLIAAGCDPYLLNDQGHTAIMEAASSGHLEVVKELFPLSRPVSFQSINISPTDVPSIDNNNEYLEPMPSNSISTPIHVNGGSTGTLSCADTSSTYIDLQESPLTLASYRGHIEVVEFLLKNKNIIEISLEELHIALMEASMDGHLDVSKLLIEHGAPVSMSQHGFETPLTLAASGGHLEQVMLLLESGASIEDCNDDGYTPLMEAAREGHATVVRYLLSKGAKVNAITDDNMETPLSLACCNGCYNTAEILLDHGADMFNCQCLPLIEASMDGHLDIMKLLISRGFDSTVPANHQILLQALSQCCENGYADAVDYLLNLPNIEIECRCSEDKTPLMKACLHGNLSVVELLLHRGADINSTTFDNDFTPLSIALLSGHYEVGKYLIDSGADLNHVLKDGFTYLMEAVKGGNLELVKLIYNATYSVHSKNSPSRNEKNSESDKKIKSQTKDINAHTCIRCDTALTLAASSGNCDIVRFLLSKGANVNYQDAKGYSSLMIAGTFGHLNVCQALVKHGANLELTTYETHDTALTQCCSAGRNHIVQFLLQQKANIEHRNLNEYTPICAASVHGHANIVSLLIKHGANIDGRRLDAIVTRRPVTPLVLSLVQKHTDVAKILIDHNANVNAIYFQTGASPLNIACSNNMESIVKALLKHHPNIENRSKTGYTPLMEAAICGSLSIGHQLIVHGADVNAVVAATKETALHLCAEKNHFQFAHLLLSHKALPNVKNKNNNAPCHIACDKGHIQIMDVLKEFNASFDLPGPNRCTPMFLAFRMGSIEMVKWFIKNTKLLLNEKECKRHISAISGLKEHKHKLDDLKNCLQIVIQARKERELACNTHMTELLHQIEGDKKASKKKSKNKPSLLQSSPSDSVEKKGKSKKNDSVRGSNASLSHSSSTFAIKPAENNNNNDRSKSKNQDNRKNNNQSSGGSSDLRFDDSHEFSSKFDVYDKMPEGYSLGRFANLKDTKQSSRVQSSNSGKITKSVSQKTQNRFQNGEKTSSVQSTHTKRSLKRKGNQESSDQKSDSESPNDSNEEWFQVNKRGSSVPVRVIKTTIINIPISSISRIIGKTGATINIIRRKCDCSIDVDTSQQNPTGFYPMKIKGYQDNIKKASNLIKIILKSPDITTEQVDEISSSDLDDPTHEIYVKGSNSAFSYHPSIERISDQDVSRYSSQPSTSTRALSSATVSKQKGMQRIEESPSADKSKKTTFSSVKSLIPSVAPGLDFDTMSSFDNTDSCDVMDFKSVEQSHKPSNVIVPSSRIRLSTPMPDSSKSSESEYSKPKFNFVDKPSKYKPNNVEFPDLSHLSLTEKRPYKSCSSHSVNDSQLSGANSLNSSMASDPYISLPDFGLFAGSDTVTITPTKIQSNEKKTSASVAPIGMERSIKQKNDQIDGEPERDFVCDDDIHLEKFDIFNYSLLPEHENAIFNPNIDVSVVDSSTLNRHWLFGDNENPRVPSPFISTNCKNPFCVTDLNHLCKINLDDQFVPCEYPHISNNSPTQQEYEIIRFILDQMRIGEYYPIICSQELGLSKLLKFSLEDFLELGMSPAHATSFMNELSKFSLLMSHDPNSIRNLFGPVPEHEFSSSIESDPKMIAFQNLNSNFSRLSLDQSNLTHPASYHELSNESIFKDNSEFFPKIEDAWDCSYAQCSKIIPSELESFIQRNRATMNLIEDQTDSFDAALSPENNSPPTKNVNETHVSVLSLSSPKSTSPSSGVLPHRTRILNSRDSEMVP